MRPRARDRGGGAIHPDVGVHDGRRTARRQTDPGQALRSGADRAAGRDPGVADQSGPGVRRRRSCTQWPAGGPDRHGANDSRRHHRVVIGPPGAHCAPFTELADPGGARKRQPRLGRAQPRRRHADPGDRQRLAAGLGAAGRCARCDHVELSHRRALPGRARHRPGTAATPAPAGTATTAPAGSRRRPTATLGAPDVRRHRRGDGRRADRRGGRPGGVRRGHGHWLPDP